MATAGLKLNPAIARETAGGQIQCLICNTQVRAKIWLAHVNSKKHRESADLLKKKLKDVGATPSPSSATAPKRPPTRGASPPSKKSKEPELEEDEDEDDDEEMATMSETPWQREVVEKAAARNNVKVLPPTKGGIIEGVPQGFFDDKRKDERVLEAVEKKADMEAEYEKFMKEVSEKEAEEKEQLEAEVEQGALERELAHIDEQMERLRKLNEFEIRKEEIEKKAKVAPKKMELEESDDDSDIGDLDLDNWRAKRVA